jgi:nucleoside-diphosphate-sugar epimerase
MPMRVLVTGAAGFIGSHVTRQVVEEGHEVWGAILPGESTERIADLRSRVSLHPLDLGNRGQVEHLIAVSRPECAIHLAWYVVPGKYWNSPANLSCVSMSLGLAEVLATSGCARLVGVGTCAEYDWDYAILSEDVTPLRPRTLYGACKNATREVLEVYCRQVGMSFAWTRFFYLYGPGEKKERLVPSVVRSMLRGEPARLNSGTQLRDFLHVQDVASAAWQVAKSPLLGPVNIGSGESVQVRTLVEMIARLVGGNPIIEWGAIPDGPQDAPALTADVRKLKQATGWAPSFTLEEGLCQTIAWWKGRAKTMT